MNAEKFCDPRISINVSYAGFTELANEYLAKYGRKATGGGTMTYYTFKITSYRTKDHNTQIDVTIDYRNQTIELKTI